MEWEKKRYFYVMSATKKDRRENMRVGEYVKIVGFHIYLT